MASTYSPNLGIELITPGEQDGSWGDTTNRNLGTLLEQAIAGLVRVVLIDADVTLTSTVGASNQARNAILIIEGAATATRDVIIPSVSKLYVITNSTSGGQIVRIKTSAGTAVNVPAGVSMHVFCDGTDTFMISSNQTSSAGTVTSITVAAPLTGGTITNAGTIGLATVSGLVPGVYGGATSVPVISVDAYGRITNASSVSIGGGAGSGTVTRVNTGTGLTGGPITTVGTVSLATSGVSSGSYGGSSAIPRITVDQYGRITSITTQAPAAGTSLVNGSNSVAVSSTGVSIQSAGNITITNASTLTVSGPAAFNGTTFSVSAPTITTPIDVRIGTSNNQIIKLGSDTGDVSLILASSGTTLRGVFWDGASFFLGRGNFGAATANNLSFTGDTNTSGSAAFSVGTVFKTGGGTFAATSDERLKDILGEYTMGLSDLLQLNPIRFKYKEGDKKTYVGLSAQETFKTSFKGMVSKNEAGYLTVDNSELIYAVINSLREIDRRLQFLGG